MEKADINEDENGGAGGGMSGSADGAGFSAAGDGGSSSSEGPSSAPESGGMSGSTDGAGFSATGEGGSSSSEGPSSAESGGGGMSGSADGAGFSATGDGGSSSSEGPSNLSGLTPEQIKELVQHDPPIQHDPLGNAIPIVIGGGIIGAAEGVAGAVAGAGKTFSEEVSLAGLDAMGITDGARQGVKTVIDHFPVNPDPETQELIDKEPVTPVPSGKNP
jgi:hypothetical protein